MYFGQHRNTSRERDKAEEEEGKKEKRREITQTPLHSPIRAPAPGRGTRSKAGPPHEDPGATKPTIVQSRMLHQPYRRDPVHILCAEVAATESPQGSCPRRKGTQGSAWARDVTQQHC